jgi:DNA modification methylase
VGLIFERGSVALRHGDCLAILPTLDDESIDAIVTDPPYLLQFMGKAWDSPTVMSGHNDPTRPEGHGGAAHDHGVAGHWQPNLMQQWHEAWAREAFRVAKPGAHLLAFGGTRTVHRMTSAIEDAGWEIRDTLVWAYASGFPKSLDVSKAIDKAAGAERERPRSLSRDGDGFDPKGTLTGVRSATQWCESCGKSRGSQPANCKCDTTGAPATDAAREWQGWGTALKPAWEPIVMARKPLRGTVAGNVQAFGTGALNIDGTRIGTGGDKGEWPITDRKWAETSLEASRDDSMQVRLTDNSKGRWPANVILTDPIFDGDTPGVVGGGEAAGAVSNGNIAGNGYHGNFGRVEQHPGYGDSGTYSRFFLIPKAARRDREPLGHTGERVNTHPTVKPTALMAHLIRLVTPPGGTVLEPFAGSGSTLVAADREKVRIIGIERDEESCEIIVARLNAEPDPDVPEAPRPKATRKPKVPPVPGQVAMDFG